MVFFFKKASTESLQVSAARLIIYYMRLCHGLRCRRGVWKRVTRWSRTTAQNVSRSTGAWVRALRKPEKLREKRENFHTLLRFRENRRRVFKNKPRGSACLISSVSPTPVLPHERLRSEFSLIRRSSAAFSWNRLLYFAFVFFLLFLTGAEECRHRAENPENSSRTSAWEHGAVRVSYSQHWR